MSADLLSVVPVVYVTDIDRSERFYQLLGLSVLASGSDDTWRWSYLRSGELGVLLARGTSALPAQAGPVQLYLTAGDLESLSKQLSTGGHEVQHLGYPDHAPGGEVRVTDPDGHGIVVAQPIAVPGGPSGGTDGQRSTLQAAAAAVQRRGVATQGCEVGGGGGRACERPGEVKLADSWGDTAWTCIQHADEVLMNARGAFIATEDGQGLARYLELRRRRAADTPGPA
jgi:hypothetical protein